MFHLGVLNEIGIKMVEIQFTKKAAEKYDLLLNGLRKVMNEFFDKLSKDKINLEELTHLFSGNDNNEFYSYQYQSIYLILARDRKKWFVLDLLTPQEYKDDFGIFIKN